MRYAHLAPSHKAKAVDVMDKTLHGEKYHNFITVRGFNGVSNVV